MLDHLLCELRSRFRKHQRRALLGFSIVPSLFVSLESDDHISRFKALSDLYENDLPSPECLESELHSCQIKWRRELEDHGESSLPTGLTHMLRHISSMYPNITALIKILCTLPVTTCTAERSSSSLKRSKTPFRSTMTNTRLTGLTLLHVHRDIPIDLEAALDKFARLYPRRMRMTEIFDDSFLTAYAHAQNKGRGPYTRVRESSPLTPFLEPPLHRREKAETSHRQRRRISSTRTCTRTTDNSNTRVIPHVH